VQNTCLRLPTMSRGVAPQSGEPIGHEVEELRCRIFVVVPSLAGRVAGPRSADQSGCADPTRE
jgi:hypothetical protein